MNTFYTPAELCAWLEGYLQDKKDSQIAQTILEKLKQTSTTDTRTTTSTSEDKFVLHVGKQLLKD